jgi:hypothetical protein
LDHTIKTASIEINTNEYDVTHCNKKNFTSLLERETEIKLTT